MKKIKRDRKWLWVVCLASLVFIYGVYLAQGSELLCKDNIVIERLVVCESGVNYGAINHHDRGSASYGVLQFKADTFYRYNLIYKVLPDLEREEVLNVIMEPETQIKLAKKILEEPKGRDNWLNCLNG